MQILPRRLTMKTKITINEAALKRYLEQTKEFEVCPEEIPAPITIGRPQGAPMHNLRIKNPIIKEIIFNYERD